MNLLRKSRVIAWLIASTIAWCACSCGSDDSDGTSAAAGASGQSPGQGGSAGTQVTGPCAADCTGARMCNDAAQCVCAPGWEGADCAIASKVSDPAKRSKQEVCDRLASARGGQYTEWVASGAGECDPGTVPYSGQVAALGYLNFYRWMIGVGPVQVDPSVAKAEQECAKILNYEFSHSPSPSTKCYTAAGAGACGDSLIAGGFGLVGQVDGYALEVGQNLIHRRNVLAVGRAGIWFGASTGSSAMHYGGAYPALATDPAYVAHPGPGPNVRTQVAQKWFVQKGTATTPPLSARVTVVATNEQKPMKTDHHFNDFSSFDPDGWVPELDVAYKVELVDDASTVFGSYQTTFITCP